MGAKRFLLGAGLTVAARALLPRLLMVKFAAGVRKLNAGDYSSLLKAEQRLPAVRAACHQGSHEHSGTHRHQT